MARRFSKERKRKIVLEVLASGEPVNVVARSMGLHPQTVHRWMKEFQEGGADVWNVKAASRPKRFTEEFIWTVVAAAKKAPTLTEVAQRFDVSVALVSSWVKKAEALGDAAFAGVRTERNQPHKTPRKKEARRRSYSEQEKIAAAKAALASDEPISKVAKRLRLNPQVLREWVKAYEADGGRFVHRTSRPRAVFDEVFKLKAVALATDPANIPAHVARDLGISKGLLSKWVKQYGKD